MWPEMGHLFLGSTFELGGGLLWTEQVGQWLSSLEGRLPSEPKPAGPTLGLDL